MNRKGYVYTIISMMLALVLLSVVSLYYESYKAATDISPAKLRTDELHYFVESAKKDLGRSMSISARRGAAYMSDYVINNHTTIANPTNTLKQIMVNGTMTSGTTFNVPYMQNQTLNSFLSSLQTAGSDLRFRTNVSIRAIDVYMYDSLHFMVMAKYNFSISDRDTAEGGVCGYENENQTLYVMVPVDGLEDPLYAYKTTNKVSRVYNHSTLSGIQVLATGTLGHGIGGGTVYNLTGYSALNQDTRINNFNASNYALVPYTVFVISVTELQFFTTVFSDTTRRILNNSGGVINLQSGDFGIGFPYVSGINGAFDLTGKEYVIVRNGNSPKVLYMGMANDIVNRLYANSTNGSCFFDRLQGNKNLTQTYRDQAATARSLLGQPNTALVGIESYINISDLNSSGLYPSITPYENYSSIDHLYFQGMPGRWIYGTPYWFRMDAYNLKTKNLTDYCDDDYAAVWHFEESYNDGSDDYTYEGSHNAPDLKLSSSDAEIATTGKAGNSIYFGGNLGQAEADVNVSETSYTLGLWFKTESGCTDCGIFSTDAGSARDDEYDRDLMLDAAAPSGGHLCVGLLGPELLCTDPGDTYNDDAWHYVVHVFENKSGGEQKLYVDGVLKKTGALKYSNRTAQTRVIVGNSKRAGSHFVGYIDDVKIWNRALAAWEITEEYQKQL